MKDNRGWRIEAGDRTAVAQALLNHGADPNSRASVLLPPCPAPESWMVRSGPPANPAEDLSSRWPLSPLQHAFLAGDFQLCKLLVTTPRTSTPDREIAWMYEVMMYCIMNTKQSIAPVIRRADAVDVITILTGPLGGSPIADAVCLAWTLAVLAKENCSGLFSSIKLETQGKPDCYCLRNHPESHGARACYGIKKEYLVQAARMIISQPAFDAGKLSLTLDATRWNKRYGTTPVQLGTVCLEEAILAGQQDIVLKLLNMKCEGMLRVEALRLAVTMATANNSSLPILETLLLHGAPLHVQEDETNHDLASPHGLRRHQSCVHLHGVGYALDDALTNLATWKTGLPCRNPLLYAICLGNKEAVGLMLRFYFTYSAPDASLTRLYVREACVRLDHAMLAVLLDFEPMRQVCLENGTSPFVFLVRNVEALCHGFGTVGSRIKFDNMTANSYHTSGIDVSHRVRQLSLWVSCVNQFGKARISYQVKDSVGKSVHNYFLEYKAYRGGDRLLLEVSRSLKNVP
ncbi:hypothetical protein QBC41DRAFT_235336 [Cercophora samala]|uniref:Uncharacterized protein n=1 Tax=Cercophora samala TaxID=330535 RepID=A0AA40D6B8_9PEZI|nr:hypothetical protein QBC41DRAFT_235336 [Cercophora samala]